MPLSVLIRKRALLSPRSATCLIVLLLIVKLALVVWNAAVFDGKTYDAGYHADRAVFGGLRAGKIQHDPPLYYLPALSVARGPEVPKLSREARGEDGEAGEQQVAGALRMTRAEKALRSDLLSRLRHTNVVWLGVFYVAWLFWSLPRLVSGHRAWFLASLLLLAIPAYQRLGAMSHPDNLFVATASVATGLWLWLRERWQRDEPVHFWQLALFALSIGVMAGTRWLAIAPAAVLAVLCVVYGVRSLDRQPLTLASRLLVLGALISAFSLTWSLYSRATSHEPGRDYTARYAPRLDGARAHFDYAHYYGSFALPGLLESGLSPDPDSFATLVYSEIWGDQWLSFTGTRDAKRWPRRILLGAALLVPFVCLGLGVTRVGALVTRLRRFSRETAARTKPELAELEAELVLLALVLLGGGLFIYWQGSAGLLPGDNSSVRFNSIAAVLPPAIALLFVHPLRPALFNLLAGYFFFLFALGFPVAMYWPK